jgi:t-SNARE complex subunit (syntaxin)
MRAIMYEIAETPESQRSTKKKSLFCLAGVLIVLFLVFVVVLLIGAVYHYHY